MKRPVPPVCQSTGNNDGRPTRADFEQRKMALAGQAAGKERR